MHQGNQIFQQAAGEGLVASVRRMFGLHRHVRGEWTVDFAMPRGDRHVFVHSSRACLVCARTQTRQETMALPEAGTPHELNGALLDFLKLARVRQGA